MILAGFGCSTVSSKQEDAAGKEGDSKVLGFWEKHNSCMT